MFIHPDTTMLHVQYQEMPFQQTLKSSTTLKEDFSVSLYIDDQNDSKIAITGKGETMDSRGRGVVVTITFIMT